MNENLSKTQWKYSKCGLESRVVDISVYLEISVGNECITFKHPRPRHCCEMHQISQLHVSPECGHETQRGHLGENLCVTPARGSPSLDPGLAGPGRRRPSLGP